MRCAEAVALECNAIFECCQVLSRYFDFWFASCAVRYGARASRPHRLLRGGLLRSPVFLLLFWASGQPVSPCFPCGRRGLLPGVDFLGSPCIPFLILGFLKPRLPLLPLWEKGVGGMRGKSARHAANRLSLSGTRLLRGGKVWCQTTAPSRALLERCSSPTSVRRRSASSSTLIARRYSSMRMCSSGVWSRFESPGP